jgi:hypothetical protein
MGSFLAVYPDLWRAQVQTLFTPFRWSMDDSVSGYLFFGTPVDQ